MATILLGKNVTDVMKEKMQADIEMLKVKGVNPKLAIVRLGEREDDLAYERGALKRCETIGIDYEVFKYSIEMSQKDLVKEIVRLNEDDKIHGILIFRPLPKQIDENEIKQIINPGKDVDSMSPVNTAKVFEGDESGMYPCTPEAVIELMDHYGIEIKGKRITVVGRSMVVGKPLAIMLIKRHGTVTVCHTRTVDLEKTCRDAEILIAAAGKAKMITKEFVSPGQIVIDVGINMDENWKLCGDVDYDEVEGIVESITPVPRGIGTVTTSVLVRNVIKSAKTMGTKLLV
jgi:methylenetetrahydrofolate dehydrogenase (NADP+)/methenyltetrahydrofolate cyclohydrolase